MTNNRLIAVLAMLTALAVAYADVSFEVNAAKLRATDDMGVIAYIVFSISMKAAGIILGLVSIEYGFRDTKGNFTLKNIGRSPLLCLMIAIYIFASIPLSIAMTTIGQTAYSGNNEQQQHNIQALLSNLDSEARRLEQSIDECNKWGRPSNCNDDSARLTQINQQKSDMLLNKSKVTASQSIGEISDQLGVASKTMEIGIAVVISLVASILVYVLPAVASHYWNGTRTSTVLSNRTNKTDAEIWDCINRYCKRLGVNKLTADQVREACSIYSKDKSSISKTRASKFAREMKERTNFKLKAVG
jgi:hypothetical protein